MIRKVIIIVLGIVCIYLIFNPVIAGKKNTQEETKFPIGCVHSGYKFDLYNIILTPSTKEYPQTIYFIRNKSNQEIYMLQAHNGHDSYVIHVDGSIRPLRWSVLAVSEPKLKYICASYDKRKQEHRVLNCKNVLELCEFPRARFGTNHRGTYWLTLNQSRTGAVRVARYHGVLLTDPKQMQHEKE